MERLARHEVERIAWRPNASRPCSSMMRKTAIAAMLMAMTSYKENIHGCYLSARLPRWRWQALPTRKGSPALPGFMSQRLLPATTALAARRVDETGQVKAHEPRGHSRLKARKPQRRSAPSRPADNNIGKPVRHRWRLRPAQMRPGGVGLGDHQQHFHRHQYRPAGGSSSSLTSRRP